MHGIRAVVPHRGGGVVNHRVRVGGFLTALLGAVWASLGLLEPGETQLGVGVAVAMVGVLIVGAADWVDR